MLQTTLIKWSKQANQSDYTVCANKQPVHPHKTLAHSRNSHKITRVYAKKSDLLLCSKPTACTQFFFEGLKHHCHANKVLNALSHHHQTKLPDTTLSDNGFYLSGPNLQQKAMLLPIIYLVYLFHTYLPVSTVIWFRSEATSLDLTLLHESQEKTDGTRAGYSGEREEREKNTRQNLLIITIFLSDSSQSRLQFLGSSHQWASLSVAERSEHLGSAHGGH